MKRIHFIAIILIAALLCSCNNSAAVGTSSGINLITQADSDAESYQAGVVSDNVYINHSLGLQYTPLAGVKFLETDSYFEQSAEGLQYEMLAVNISNMDLLYVASQRLTTPLADNTFLDVFGEALHLSSFDDKEITTSSRELFGVTYTEISTTLLLEEGEQIYTGLFTQIGQRVVLILASSTNAEGVETMFSALAAEGSEIPTIVEEFEEPTLKATPHILRV